jgi:hypothetical protein
MSEPRIFLCVDLLIAVSVCGIASSFIAVEMQGRVNQRLPKDNQLETPWWFGKYLELFRHHRSFFPETKFPKIQGLVGVTMLACLVALAVVIGII